MIAKRIRGAIFLGVLDHEKVDGVTLKAPWCGTWAAWERAVGTKEAEGE